MCRRPPSIEAVGDLEHVPAAAAVAARALLDLVQSLLRRRVLQAQVQGCKQKNDIQGCFQHIHGWHRLLNKVGPLYQSQLNSVGLVIRKLG